MAPPWTAEYHTASPGAMRSMVEAQWSTAVAGGFVVVDGQGSTLDA